MKLELSHLQVLGLIWESEEMFQMVKGIEIKNRMDKWMGGQMTIWIGFISTGVMISAT